jgi:hypothetical protein
MNPSSFFQACPSKYLVEHERVKVTNEHEHECVKNYK